MAKIVIDEKRIEEAQNVLRQMVQEGKTTAPMPAPFSSEYVVVADDVEAALVVVPIPADLKGQIGEEKVYVIPTFVANKL